jgi:hypothetical protein
MFFCRKSQSLYSCTRPFRGRFCHTHTPLANCMPGLLDKDQLPLNAGPLPGADVDLQAARDRKPDVPLPLSWACHAAARGL